MNPFWHALWNMQLIHHSIHRANNWFLSLPNSYKSLNDTHQQKATEEGIPDV